MDTLQTCQSEKGDSKEEILYADNVNGILEAEKQEEKL